MVKAQLTIQNMRTTAKWLATQKHVEGKFGKALQLNGSSDWVVIPHDEILTVDEDFTVMAWINTERHMGPNAQRWQGIVAKGNDPRSYSFLH